MKTNKAFELRTLLSTQKSLWLLALLCGVMTVVSVVGLLMVAGWFIGMTALSSVLALSFAYATPSLLIRVFALGRTLFRYGDLMVSHHAIFGLLKELRVKFFAMWVNLPIMARQHDTTTSSQKMHRLVKDIDVLNELPLRLVSPVVMAGAGVLGLIGCTALIMPKLIWAVGVLFLVFGVVVVVLRRGMTLAKTESALTQQRQSELLDTLPVLHQLLIWGRWADTVCHLSALDEAHQSHTQKIHTLRRRATLINQLIMASVVALMLWLFGQMPMNSQEGQSLAFMLALVFGVFGLAEVLGALTAEPLALGRAMMAKMRLNQLTTPQSTQNKQPMTDDVVTVSLQNLCVKMPNAISPTNPITATLTNERPTLIMGASGVGKSTLLATLAGEVLPSSGQILVNGLEYETLDFGADLGYLGQTVDIFDQTLRDNLALGRPKFDPYQWELGEADDELWAVLDKVGLSDWARSQPKGLDTPLGEYGMAISGGQARRIALARLLLTPKKILLLDEPFAGLDDATGHQVWQSLVAMQKSGKIGILIIATHQLWQDMGQVDIIQM